MKTILGICDATEHFLVT